MLFPICICIKIANFLNFNIYNKSIMKKKKKKKKKLTWSPSEIIEIFVYQHSPNLYDNLLMI